MADKSEKRRIIILGSTGSIGRNTLRVVEAFPDRFEVVGLAACSDYRTIAEQCRNFNPAFVALADIGAAGRLRGLINGSSIRVLEGEEGVASLVTVEEVDLVVSAIVGSSGLIPTYEAVRNGIDVALANKEALVMAGRIITEEAARSGADIIPVDSEHHAVFMAMRGLGQKEVAAVTLTASGGPFIKSTAAELEDVTVEQALRHPKWNMGSKITIDSATLMNKGLEIIEAHWLFGLGEDRIKVVVHPESIVHAMVHLVDGGILAYLSNPDMRLPIATALNYPETLPQGLEPLNMESVGTLTFMPPDHSRFPSIKLARRALKAGGTAPVVLNAANEVAVSAFLEDKIRFTDICGILAEVMDSCPVVSDDSMEMILRQDSIARKAASAFVADGTARIRPESKDIDNN